MIRKHIIIACVLIAGIGALIRRVSKNEPFSHEVAGYIPLEQRIAALPVCDCESRTHLKPQKNTGCPSCGFIEVNGKLCSEGDTVYGFKIISVAGENIVFLCPEGHVLKLKPAESDLNDRPRPIPKPKPKLMTNTNNV